MTNQERKLIELRILGWDDPEPFVADGEEATPDFAFEVVRHLNAKGWFLRCLDQSPEAGTWSVAFWNGGLSWYDSSPGRHPTPQDAILAAALKVALRLEREVTCQTS